MTNSSENQRLDPDKNPLHLFDDKWVRDNLGENRDRPRYEEKIKEAKRERGRVTNVLSAIGGLLG